MLEKLILESMLDFSEGNEFLLIFWVREKQRACNNAHMSRMFAIYRCFISNESVLMYKISKRKRFVCIDENSHLFEFTKCIIQRIKKEGILWLMCSRLFCLLTCRGGEVSSKIWEQRQIPNGSPWSRVMGLREMNKIRLRTNLRWRTKRATVLTSLCGGRLC